jgi:hypothetical protein
LADIQGSVQAKFGAQRADKRFCCRFPVQFEVERAEMAPLTAEGNMEIEA